MGIMTAGEMMDEIAVNVGGSINDKVRLLRWINWAVLNLASYIVLPELEKVAAVAISDGDTSFTKPTDLLGILQITVWDATEDPITYHPLRKMKKEFYPAAQEGTPSHYKIRGSDIITWPEADTDYTGEIEYVKIPAEITAQTATTDFDAYWDVAIVQLGTHYGLESLRQHEEADRWLARFLGYAGSRKLERDISADVPSGGVEVVWDYNDMVDIPPRITG
jgi:hypothetical protein